MITISEEIKAKIVIEADTSGADEAAAALEKLQGMAGGEGGIGDALAQQFAVGEEGAKGLSEALGSSEEALKANEEGATDATAALEEHQQVVEEAGSAHEEFAGQVEETANQLQTIPSSMEEVTKSAQTMSEQVSQSGETFASTGKSVADIQAAIDEFNQSDPWQGFADSLSNADKTLSQSQIFSPETIKANMAAFSEAVYSPDVTDPLTHIQTYLDQTGQSWEDFTATIGEGRMNALYDAVDQFGGTYQVFGGMSGEIEQASKNTSAFADNIQATQSAMDEFNQADPWSAFNAGAQDASKSVEEVGAATKQNEGFFSNYFGGLGDSLFGGAVDETGNVSKGLFGSIGDIAGSFDAFMRPLMMGQMAVQMVTQVGQAIYNSAAIAEGQGAHGIGTFTGAVDSMGYTMQQVGGTFSEAFGQQFMATIGAVNQALGDNKGGLTQTGGMLGGALSFASNAIMGALGVGLMATGVGIPLGFTMTQAGMEGIANNVSQWMGWGTEFTGQQATPGLEVQAQVQQGWSQIPTNVIKGTADSINNTNQILTEASDPSFIAAQNGLSHAQQYLQYQQQQYNAAHPYNQVQEALQSANDYSTMQENYAVTHPDTYWNDAMKAAQQGNWFGGFGPNQSGGGFWANIGQIFAGGPQDAGTSLGMESGGAARNWLGGLGTSAANATSGFLGGIGNALHNLFFGGDTTGASGDFGGGCFIAGTRVLMADGLEKPIEQLQKGDRVLAYDGTTQRTAAIQARMAFPQKQTYELTFSDGTILTTTDSHPIYSPDTGWKSISPASTKLENPNLHVRTLQIDDTIATTHGTCTLISLEKKHITRVFNITVDQAHTYYANGVLVHNKVTLAGGAQSFGGQGGFQLPHIDLGAIGSNLASQFSGIQLPHIDLGGIASSLGGAFSGIQLPHLDLGGIASGLGGAFSGLQLPHLDLGGIASSLGGAFSGIQLPHLDLGGIGAALSGAFSGITLPHIPDIGGMINGALGGMFSGITLPSIPDIGGMINGALGGMFSGITLPSIPDIGGMINGALGGMFSGITLPSIPNLGGMIDGALGGMFSGITLPSIPDIGGMINGAMGGMFSGIQAPKVPDLSGMINAALGGMFSGIQMPNIPNVSGMINAALGGMFSGISIPGFASGVEGFGGGLAVVGESGPELVALPGGSSVYPMSTSMNGGLSPISLGGGGGVQTANIVVNLDSQTLISLMGVSLASSINVGLGKRSY